jgi:hypothetical protein
MTTPLLDAFELLTQAELFPPRLDAAAAELAKLPGLAAEKSWLAAACERAAPARRGTEDLLVRVLRLPELESVRPERLRILQGLVVDALEHLHAAIVFVGSARSPLLEALYFKLKIPQLRRCDREELERFYGDFEKRLGSAYVRRMLKDETYAPAAVAVAGFHAAFATWRGGFLTDALRETEAEALRDELLAAAQGLDVPLRQARLLAQAALAPRKELEAALLLQKNKKRSSRAEEEDTHPLLEKDPPDPAAPTFDERAELGL